MDLWVNHFMSNTFQQYRHYTIIPHYIPLYDYIPIDYITIYKG